MKAEEGGRILLQDEHGRRILATITKVREDGTLECRVLDLSQPEIEVCHGVDCCWACSHGVPTHPVRGADCGCEEGSGEGA